jgi:hypothetical protein
MVVMEIFFLQYFNILHITFPPPKSELGLVAPGRVFGRNVMRNIEQ